MPSSVIEDETRVSHHRGRGPRYPNLPATASLFLIFILTHHPTTTSSHPTTTQHHTTHHPPPPHSTTQKGGQREGKNKRRRCIMRVWPFAQGERCVVTCHMQRNVRNEVIDL